MSDAEFIALVIAIGVATLCILYFWRAGVERTRQLNHWGSLYGVQRFPEEDNDQYQERIYNRIDITGGKRNP